MTTEEAVARALCFADVHDCGCVGLCEATDQAPYFMKLARAAIAVMPQGGWLPIDSAPKDGTLVLLCWPNWDQGVRISRWLKNAHRWSWDGSHDYRVTVGEPTHWRPLPDPPGAEVHGDSHTPSRDHAYSLADQLDAWLIDQGATVSTEAVRERLREIVPNTTGLASGEPERCLSKGDGWRCVNCKHVVRAMVEPRRCSMCKCSTFAHIDKPRSSDGSGILDEVREVYPDCQFCHGAGFFKVIASDTYSPGDRIACGNCLERREQERGE